MNNSINQFIFYGELVFLLQKHNLLHQSLFPKIATAMKISSAAMPSTSVVCPSVDMQASLIIQNSHYMSES